MTPEIAVGLIGMGGALGGALQSVPSPEGFLGRALAAEEKLYRQIQQGRWSEI